MTVYYHSRLGGAWNHARSTSSRSDSGQVVLDRDEFAEQTAEGQVDGTMDAGNVNRVVTWCTRQGNLVTHLLMPRKKTHYLSGINLEECVAPIPGRPCFTGL